MIVWVLILAAGGWMYWDHAKPEDPSGLLLLFGVGLVAGLLLRSWDKGALIGLNVFGAGVVLALAVATERVAADKAPAVGGIAVLLVLVGLVMVVQAGHST